MKNKLDEILLEIEILEENKKIMLSVYNENIAYKLLQYEFLAVEMADKAFSDYRILRLCRTGK